MDRIAVVLPGIMGSVLRYHESEKHGEIWGENFIENYHRLIHNPDVLKWTGKTASASLLKTARLSDWVPFVKIELWKNSLEFLAGLKEFRLPSHLIELGYDWRASLIESAKLVSQKLSNHVNAHLDSLRSSSDPQFTFLTHSMGGLVLRIALGLKLINYSWIDRIVHIGSPLKGAAVAFRVAYDRSTLPLLREILRQVHRKNGALFESNLSKCFKSFPSLYQLMPQREIRYLFYSPSVITNPLEETFLPETCRQLAEEAHQKLADAEQYIITHKIKVITIYTAINEDDETELMYRVTAIGPPDTGYRIEETVGKTTLGDGTVPAESASGSVAGAVGKSVLNVKHAYLCNSKKVVELLATII